MKIIHPLCDSRPSEQELTAFEESIGGKLPEDYKEFLRLHNGGRPERSLFQFKTTNGMEESSRVHYFFCLWNGRIGNLKDSRILYSDRLPAGVTPIAIDPVGNIFAIGTADDVRANVYFWDHDSETDDEGPTYVNLSHIAHSFSEFVRSLK